VKTVQNVDSRETGGRRFTADMQKEADVKLW